MIAPPKFKPPPFQENFDLLERARKKITGANNHRLNGLIATYRVAVAIVKYARDQKDYEEILTKVREAETDLLNKIES